MFVQEKRIQPYTESPVQVWLLEKEMTESIKLMAAIIANKASKDGRGK